MKGEEAGVGSAGRRQGPREGAGFSLRAGGDCSPISVQGDRSTGGGVSLHPQQPRSRAGLGWWFLPLGSMLSLWGESKVPRLQQETEPCQFCGRLGGCEPSSGSRTAVCTCSCVLGVQGL